MATLLGASLISFGVGILTGVFGVGGGFLMTPALMIFLGVPGSVAVGTDLAAILTNSSFGLYKRRGTRTVDLKLALTISSGGVVGVLIGSRLLKAVQEIDSWVIGGREYDAVELSLLLLFVLLLVWIASYILYDRCRLKRGELELGTGLLRRLIVPPMRRFSSVHGQEISVTVLACLGLFVGCLTGLMGIGGGVILLPILVYFVGQDPKKAAGTSLVMVWVASTIGVLYKGMVGHVSVSLWTAMIVGGLVGTSLGTRIGLKAASEKLKFSFLYVVLLALGIVSWRLVCLIGRTV